jgi:hypothetical protein
LYPHYDNVELSAVFFPKRTPISLQHKAHRLGIHKTDAARKIIIYRTSRCAQDANFKGRSRNNKGYVYITFKGGDKILEHRYVMEQKLGRKLAPGEAVHHINGDKTDNRIENLALMGHGEHTVMHHTGLSRSPAVRRKIGELAKARLQDKTKHPAYKPIPKEQFMDAIMRLNSPKKVCQQFGLRSRKSFYNKLDEFGLKEWYRCLTA